MVLLDASHSESTHDSTQQDSTQQGSAQQESALEKPPHDSTSPAPDQQDRRLDETPVVAADAPPAQVDGRAAVGRSIRAAREARDWDIDELVRRTSLSPRILRGMEAGDFSASRGDCYARGHLRILARALSMDEAPLLAAVPASDPLAEDENDSDPEYDALAPRRRYLTTALIVVAMLLALVAAVVLT